MMHMTLSELDIIRLLPYFMRKDEAVKAISKALNPFFQELGERLPGLKEWAAIDNMNSAELDEMAYENHIEWYDKTLPLDKKRDSLKTAILLKEKQGTKWAIEESIRAAYDLDPEIKEWFEYSGTPGCFRVTLTLKGPVDYMRVLQTINYVKRESAHLDFVELKTIENSNLYVGHANATVTTAGLKMDKNDLGRLIFYISDSGDYYENEIGNKYIGG